MELGRAPNIAIHVVYSIKFKETAESLLQWIFRKLPSIFWACKTALVSTRVGNQKRS